MSIAAISSIAVAPVGVTPAVKEASPARDGTAEQARQQQPTSSRAHPFELVDALVDKVAPAGTQLDSKAQQAVQRFAYALMQDLHTVAGSGDAAPARADWNDIGSQLGTLASAAAAHGYGDGNVSLQSLSADVPPMPSPLTPATAAVHLMQVPSSRLVEAFIALRGAVGSIPDGGSRAGGDDRAQLSAFLQQLAESAPQAASSGTLLHARA